MLFRSGQEERHVEVSEVCSLLLFFFRSRGASLRRCVAHTPLCSGFFFFVSPPSCSYSLEPSLRRRVAHMPLRSTHLLMQYLLP